MKIALGVILLGMALIVLLQSCATSVGGAMTNDQMTKLDAGLGFLTGFALLVAGGLAFQLPRAAAVVLALAGAVALLAGSGKYADLPIWGGVMLAIAVVAIFLRRASHGSHRG